jgi:hypothetical protein
LLVAQHPVAIQHVHYGFKASRFRQILARLSDHPVGLWYDGQTSNDFPGKLWACFDSPLKLPAPVAAFRAEHVGCGAAYAASNRIGSQIAHIDWSLANWLARSTASSVYVRQQRSHQQGEIGRPMQPHSRPSQQPSAT